MDLFIYLKSGIVAPITGCTAVASIDAVGTSIATTATATAAADPFDPEIDPHLLTVASNTGIVIGMYVYGVSIPPLTTVVGVSGSTKVIISNPVTANIGAQGTPLNVAFIGPSAADMKMLAQNSGTYRDLFSFVLNSSAGAAWSSGESNGGGPILPSAAFSSSAENGGSVQSPGAVNPLTFSNKGVPVTFETDESSDELQHVPPRRLSWVEALWSFSCTVDSETVAMSFLKREVLGWGNVQPDV
jgi:hypothetical protein